MKSIGKKKISNALDHWKTIRMDMNPVWIELVPYVSFLAAVAAFGVKIGRLLQKLDTSLDDIKLLKTVVV
ncbi:MAG: hypothetical protein D4R88_01380 [Methanosarcinales archaeon]|nr:MAG: hypothetical protein D4R88_01380 [Methanosarcinales archaeon]